MKVTFKRDFDFSPAAFKGALTTAYKAGQTYTVTQEAADAAVAAGAGEIVQSPKDKADGGTDRRR